MSTERDSFIDLLARDVVSRVSAFFDSTGPDTPEDPAQEWAKGTTELVVVDNTRQVALSLAVMLHAELSDHSPDDLAVLTTAEAFRGWLTTDENPG